MLLRVADVRNNYDIALNCLEVGRHADFDIEQTHKLKLGKLLLVSPDQVGERNDDSDAAAE